MVRVYRDIETLNIEVAELFVSAAKDAIEKHGSFIVALTGGSSPLGLHRLLASTPYREQVAWDKVVVFYGDERWVPLTDERSNAKMSFETLLDHVSVPKSQIFPMWDDELTPEAFADRYEAKLKEQLGDRNFDLILLGMGGDGHTASWFPGEDVINEHERWVAAYFLEPQDMYRVTLTVPLVNRAHQLAVIAYGEGKSIALAEVLEGDRAPEMYPAQLLSPLSGTITWFVDDAAAQRLSADYQNKHNYNL